MSFFGVWFRILAAAGRWSLSCGHSGDATCVQGSSHRVVYSVSEAELFYLHHLRSCAAVAFGSLTTSGGTGHALYTSAVDILLAFLVNLVLTTAQALNTITIYVSGVVCSRHFYPGAWMCLSALFYISGIYVSDLQFLVIVICLGARLLKLHCRSLLLCRLLSCLCYYICCSSSLECSLIGVLLDWELPFLPKQKASTVQMFWLCWWWPAEWQP